MARIWVGDSRLTPFKDFCEFVEEVDLTAAEEYSEETFENFFIIDNKADYSWLKTVGLTRLANAPENAEQISIIFMLGLNDCINSLIYGHETVQKAAENYAKTVNDIVKTYIDNNLQYSFFICSIGPVNSRYACSFYDTGSISKETLNNAINTFNNKLKDSCDIKFIDCNNYLCETGFETLDGVHYSTNTSQSLYNYITNNSITSLGILFSPRFTVPQFVTSDTDRTVVKGAEYWLSPIAANNNTGYSPFAIITKNNPYEDVGSTLPNCTAYAWGRFYEMLGTRPKLYTGNAETWYGANNTLIADLDEMAKNGTEYDGYRRGDTPEPGAVICWEGVGSAAGHVAIVEQVNDDGSIIIGESGYESSYFWKLTKRTLNTQVVVTYDNGTFTEVASSKSTGTDNNWGQNANYKFQGFIYCPTSLAISEERLCTKNSYNISREEMEPNAQFIWQYLGTRNWTMNAVAAFLGNLEYESKMSPCCWEANIAGSDINEDGTHTLNNHNIEASKSIFISEKLPNGRYPGYGIVQWTPYNKYTDWAADQSLDYWKMSSQLERINFEYETKYQQWDREEGLDDGYDMSFEEFTRSEETPYFLAGAFAFCYERPGSSTGTQAERDQLKKVRGEAADYWYEFLKALPPITLDIQLRLEDLKIKSLTYNSVELSFIAHNAKNVWYQSGSSGQKNEIELGEDFTCICIDNLIPNTEYSVDITAFGNDDSEVVKNITFNTLQSFPKIIESVSLQAIDSRLPNRVFQVDFLEHSNKTWGYWGKPSIGGYVIQLIVNGVLVEEKTKSSLAASWVFNINEEFPDFEGTLGDLIQIGVRTYVKDSEQTKIYDKNEATISNSICFLSAPVTTYLNI